MPDPARVPALDERLRAAIDDAAEATSLPVYLVGGAVRDLLLGRPTLDADLVVEGDGAAFGRALARALGGRLVVHRAFGTAEVFVDDRVLDIGTASGRRAARSVRRPRRRGGRAAACPARRILPG
jgi:tRNA nucleotidyltransferase (CCA-adding enzyme)